MLAKPASLGYLRFWCERCEQTFNERTGAPFNFLEVPTDIMFQVVLRGKCGLDPAGGAFAPKAAPACRAALVCR